MSINHNYTVLERFLQYVTIDTQSDPMSNTCPSTQKQKNLGRVLVDELLALGLADAHLDEFGYVYATLPSNVNKQVPVICLCSHMDTSPDCSGTGVKPIVHKNYTGADIVLPDDPTQVLRLNEHDDLTNQIGNDLVTASGTTLLGADNKAGVAEIMDAVSYLVNNPGVKHGTLKILFTPDEEIGRGVDKVDLKKLGATYAYTVDGENAGCVEDQTFSADGMKIVFKGVPTHPGFAKGKMISAIKMAAAMVNRLGIEISPEGTSNLQGFVHPVAFAGNVEQAEVNLIVRHFETDGLQILEQKVETICNEVVTKFGGGQVKIEVKEQYRNMKDVLNTCPQVMEHALEAVTRAGMQAKRTYIRGGTDGSRLSQMGLPCPNIFAGEHAFHSTLEWVSVQDMQKAVDTLIHLIQIWEEKS